MEEFLNQITEWGTVVVNVLTMILVMLKGRTTKTAQEKLVEKNQKALTKQLNKQAKINAKIEKLQMNEASGTTTSTALIVKE